MSITETPAPTAKPKKKRKPAAKRAAAPKPDVAKVEYPGLTANQCADSCGKDGCAISRRNYCAHPRKGGLQALDLVDADALRRLQKAQLQLATVDATKRFS
jgi:hypothetical protein